MTLELNETAARLVRALEAHGIPCAIGGAIAYGFWGAARGTKDIDLNVFVPAEQARAALEVLAAAGVELDLERALRTATERGDAKGYVGQIPIDLFFDSIPLHEEASKRVVRVMLAGVQVNVLSAEDTVVLKLLFNRPKDLLDIERVVALQGARLDRAYVRRWLDDLVGADDGRVAYWTSLCEQVPVT